MKVIFEAGLRAIEFLTIVPLRLRDGSDGDSQRLLPWFPVVGLLIGIFLYGVNFLFGFLATDYVRPVLVLIFWEVITGGLHIDGLADTVDGLARRDKAGILQAMRDERFGAFACGAVVLILMGKCGALMSSGPHKALILSPVLGRWAMFFLASISPAADPEHGIGRYFAGYKRSFALVYVSLLVGFLGFWLIGRSFFLIFGIVILFVIGVSGFFKKKIGGVTGDIFGFTCEFVELLVLLVDE